jgi:hypothetical protein
MYSFNAVVVMKDGADSAWWNIRGGITRNTGAASTAIVGSNTVETGNTGGAAAGWAFTISADTTNGSLKLLGSTNASGVKAVVTVHVTKLII